jgi:hypothetical protein
MALADFISRYMGITAGSLFPGLDGACEELTQRNFDIDQLERAGGPLWGTPSFAKFAKRGNR